MYVKINFFKSHAYNVEQLSSICWSKMVFTGFLKRTLWSFQQCLYTKVIHQVTLGMKFICSSPLLYLLRRELLDMKYLENDGLWVLTLTCRFVWTCIDCCFCLSVSLLREASVGSRSMELFSSDQMHIVLFLQECSALHYWGKKMIHFLSLRN
jgi:hypothetical protein